MRKLRSKARFVLPLLLAPSFALLSAGKADALLAFSFVQQGPDVELNAMGSLTGLPAYVYTDTGIAANAIVPSSGSILLGSGLYKPYYRYPVVGPASFGTGLAKFLVKNSSSYNHLGLEAIKTGFAIDTDYVEGSAISYSGTFANTTLADLGLSSTSGLLATYTIGSDLIKVYAGPVPAPGPLPWIGGGVAFGFSRRLRSRLRSNQSSAQS